MTISSDFYGNSGLLLFRKQLIPLMMIPYEASVSEIYL